MADSVHFRSGAPRAGFRAGGTGGFLHARLFQLPGCRIKSSAKSFGAVAAGNRQQGVASQLVEAWTLTETSWQHPKMRTRRRRLWKMRLAVKENMCLGEKRGTTCARHVMT